MKIIIAGAGKAFKETKLKSNIIIATLSCISNIGPEELKKQKKTHPNGCVFLLYKDK